MTAKQKAARAKFKVAVTEAKKLRKKNPKLTQAQALKQAFAISYKKSKVGAVKKKTAPVKKAATKKKAAVKKAVSYHKDTKSHNVNIRVMSGIDKNDNKILNEIKFLKTDIIHYENAIKRIKKELPSLTSGEKIRAKQIIKNFTMIKNEKKVHINQLKKFI